MRALIVLQIVTLVVGFASLLYANYLTGQARIAGRRDICYLLRGLVAAATQPNPRSRNAANDYIRKTALSNCNLYAQGVTFKNAR